MEETADVYKPNASIYVSGIRLITGIELLVSDKVETILQYAVGSA
jgi:hypothetical protein